MPDIPITGLPEQTTTAATDVLPIVKGSTTNKVQVANLLGGSGGSSLVGFLQAGTGAVARDLQKELREQYKITQFSVTGSGDEVTKVQAAIDAVSAAGGGDLLFPISCTIGSPLTWRPGVRLVGVGAVQRYNGAVTPVRINCTGSGGLVVAPGASTTLESFEAFNLHFDGTNSSANSDGLYLNATAGSSVIRSVRTVNCAFTNFKRNQIRSDGTVFSVVHERISLNNYVNAASDCVLIQNGTPGQWTFIEPVIIPCTAGTWGINATTGFSVKTIGGTIGPSAAANGIYANCGLIVDGTHIEGNSSGNTGTIGVQYIGSGGAFINPSYCATFGTGVKIGDGTGTAARGWFVAGGVGGFNAGGGGDIWVTAGASRQGIIGQMNFVGGSITVTDDRYTTNGIVEVTRLDQLSNKSGTFMPVARGATTAGTGTYANQDGAFRRKGDVVDFWMRVKWTAHTGTGQLQITGLPFQSGSGIPLQTFAVRGDSLGSGNAIQAWIGNSATTINMETFAGGNSAALAIAGTGDLMIAGSYIAA